MFFFYSWSGQCCLDFVISDHFILLKIIEGSQDPLLTRIVCVDIYCLRILNWGQFEIFINHLKKINHCFNINKIFKWKVTFLKQKIMTLLYIFSDSTVCFCIPSACKSWTFGKVHLRSERMRVRGESHLSVTIETVLSSQTQWPPTPLSASWL